MRSIAFENRTGERWSIRYTHNSYLIKPTTSQESQQHVSTSGSISGRREGYLPSDCARKLCGKSAQLKDENAVRRCRSFINSNKGKVVFITGGGTGVGLATAKAFVATGAKVFLTQRRSEPLKAAKQEIEFPGGEVDVATADVTNKESLKAAVAVAAKRFGRIDIVVASAGSTAASGTTIENADASEWWSNIEINLKGPFLTAKATLPELKKTGDGCIVSISSSVAQARHPGHSASNVYKNATNRLAEWVDIESRAEGVKSIAIHPGAIAIELSLDWAASIGAEAQRFLTMTPELHAWTVVRLTSGSEDWLSGRCFDASWGFDVVHDLKEKIVEQDALKNRLALPI